MFGYSVLALKVLEAVAKREVSSFDYDVDLSHVCSRERERELKMGGGETPPALDPPRILDRSAFYYKENVSKLTDTWYTLGALISFC